MTYLLDTHALLWWSSDPDKLGKVAHDIIEDNNNTILVSAVSAMEITTKFRLGKLPDAEILAKRFAIEIGFDNFIELSITIAHAELAGKMTIDHKDPFDRLLIAQAKIGNIPLISNEKIFDEFGIQRIW